MHTTKTVQLKEQLAIYLYTSKSLMLKISKKEIINITRFAEDNQDYYYVVAIITMSSYFLAIYCNVCITYTLKSPP